MLLSGIDWGALRPGVRLLVAPSHDPAGTVEVPPEPVVLELSAWVPPCKTVAPAFTDRRFDRTDHDKHPGWARAYAWVLNGGTVHVGSRVTVLH
jgi:hypothetical protein